MLLGIGVSIYVEVTAGPTAGGEHAEVEVRPDGSVRILTGTSPHGQGHATVFAQLVHDRLGVPFESIRYMQGDTAQIPIGRGTYGARSATVGSMRTPSRVNVSRSRR